jgi:methionyl aminopeptidase
MIRLFTNEGSGPKIKSAKELDRMRDAGKVVTEAKMAVKSAVRPGVTTGELDRIAEDVIRSHGAVPSFKGYTAGGPIPFPATICASINEEIVHGIPGDRVLEEGDILSVDFGAIVEGFHGDSAFTIGVGEITEQAQHLIDATREALCRGIAAVRAGARIGDISSAVQQYAEGEGFSVVRQYVGHGIGRALHEDPQIPNYGVAGRGGLLREGMTICIEPMLNVGGWETMQLEDGWTVVTADGSLSAHYEDTIIVKAGGSEVLTTPEGYVF